MSRTILVPVDGSAFSERALGTAGKLAKRSGDTVELIHVSLPLSPWIAPELALTLDLDVEPADGEAYLNGLRNQLPFEVPVRVTSLRGNPQHTLVAHIQSTEPALVVMATHGRGGFSRLWLGSVADWVARRSSAPVLLIRPAESPADDAAPPISDMRRILVPLDGSIASEEIIDRAVASFGAAGELLLIRVVSPLAARAHPEAGPHGPVLRSELNPEAQLDRAVHALGRRGVKARRLVVVSEHVAPAIVDAAADSHADAIAMTTHARRGLSRFVMGSVADKVVRGASCPVLLFHPTHDAVDVRRRLEVAAHRGELHDAGLG